MTDRELLELAAKAAGIEVYSYDGDEDHVPGEPWTVQGWWNPLTDDGDALRLAVKLRIVIDPFHGIVMVHGMDIGIGPNDIEATRRAIVRAAAEIGKPPNVLQEKTVKTFEPGAIVEVSVDGVGKAIREYADEIASLRQQLADATEVANLSDGMYRSAIRQLAEKDAGLEAATQIINQYASELNELQEQAIKDVNHFRTAAAEAQAREKVLREVVQLAWLDDIPDGVSPEDVMDKAEAALALPSDSTALDSAISQAMREALLGAINEWEKPYGLTDGSAFIERLRRMAKELK